MVRRIMKYIIPIWLGSLYFLPPNVKFLYNSLLYVYNCVVFFITPPPNKKQNEPKQTPNRCVSSWWFQLIWKSLLVKISSFPQILDEHEKHVKFHHPVFGCQRLQLPVFLPGWGFQLPAPRRHEKDWCQGQPPTAGHQQQNPRKKVSGCLGGWNSGWVGGFRVAGVGGVVLFLF